MKKFDIAKFIGRKFKKAEGQKKVVRDAFIYMEPRRGTYKRKNFAECQTCIMWTGPERERCTIHGPNKEIKAQATCALYVNGEPMEKEAGHEMTLVTPEESGLVKGPPRCENCKYGTPESTCELFRLLNQAMPENFDLDEKIHPKGCCNAFMPKKI